MAVEKKKKKKNLTHPHTGLSAAYNYSVTLLNRR